MKQIIQLAGVACLCLSMSACSWFMNNDDEKGAGGHASIVEQGAQSYGVSDQAQFDGEDGEYGFTDGRPSNQTFYFAFDNSKVNTQYDANLTAQANYLKDHPNVNVRLEGNTDERGSREYNIALGERRALSIARYLEIHGVPKQQLSIISYGAEKPVVLGHAESAYHMNRRVMLKYPD
ncbi:MAG: peptidoglycan-associated lipoprotein [marine bacterium B5-7]|nr:MAG: peptidoglycan-associated lipoprotein [marine bacterium B5-7]